MSVFLWLLVVVVGTFSYFFVASELQRRKKNNHMRKVLNKVRLELDRLRVYLDASRETDEPLNEIVIFFDEVSKVHDRGIDDLVSAFKDANYNGRYNDVLEKLEILQRHLVSAGRAQYGWNRTKPGQTVTEENVFLGNIYGLFTHPVRFWKRTKDEKKGNWGYPNMESLNSYDVVSIQARDFVRNHADGMIPIIDYLALV